MSDQAVSDDAVNSLESGSDYSLDERSTDSSDSDWSPPQRKAPLRKDNLVYTRSSGSDRPSTSRKRQLSYIPSSGSDCPSTSRKHKLNYITSSGRDSIHHFETLKADAKVSVSNPFTVDSQSWDSLLKSSNNCEQMLRQIIRTAYQFTRHSHRQKLNLKDLEKAFKIHRIDMKPDDYSFIDMTDVDSIENGNESQAFTCSGMWLRKP